MAGQLDSAFKQIAKQVVADLGSSFDSSIVYTEKHREVITQLQVHILQAIRLTASKLLLSMLFLQKMMVEKEEKRRFI